VMIDAPGYGYAVGNKKETQDWGKMINLYFDKSTYLHRVLCLVDSEHLVKVISFS